MFGALGENRGKMHTANGLVPHSLAFLILGHCHWMSLVRIKNGFQVVFGDSDGLDGSIRKGF